MAKFEKFLFFYSIITTTILMLSFGVFFPKPVNIISILSLLPVVFYFWARLTSPQAVGPDRWSVRFLISITILSVLGIYTFFLAKQITDVASLNTEQLSQSQRENERLKKEILELKTKPSPTPEPNIEEEDLSDILKE